MAGRELSCLTSFAASSPRGSSLEAAPGLDRECLEALAHGGGVGHLEDVARQLGLVVAAFGVGRCTATPEATDYEQTERGRGGEIQLTDALLALSLKRDMYAYEFEGTRFDAGDKFGYLQAIIAYALRHDEIAEPFMAHLKDVVNTL